MTNDAQAAIIDLAEVAADGWFEQLAEELEEFEALARVIGDRFLGFSFIAGVRITSVEVDAATPHASQVEFAIGDGDQGQRLALSEFRERLATALLSVDGDTGPLPQAPGPADAQRYIGPRRMLLAALFGIRLRALRHGDGEPTITLSLGEVEEHLSRDGLTELLDNAVRSELARVRPSQPFSIDFKRVPQAEQANADGDYEQTIALLGSWPGPLSMFLRTPQGQALGDNERAKLVRALGALGRAYLERDQGDWAEDVLRLGIQFGQELPACGRLFTELGRARMRTERPGEAIGLFRRALSLGDDRDHVLPLLAEAFAARGRYVAALGCLREATALGVGAPRLDPVRASVTEALGTRLQAYETLLGDS